MKYQEKTNVVLGANDEIARVDSEIKGTTMHIEEFNAMMRNMPKGQRRMMEQGIKVVGVIPIYGVEGPHKKGQGKVERAFTKDWTALNATKDEVDWLLKRYPEFSAEAKPTGKDPRIVIK